MSSPYAPGPTPPGPPVAAPTPAPGTSLLAKAGTVIGAIVKHVPVRGVLWLVIGFVLGWVFLAISLVVNVAIYGRGAELSAYLLPLAIALPFGGAYLLGMHGLHRGAARAAFELQRKFGLVDHVLGRFVPLLEARVGGVVTNLPLAQLEEKAKGALDTYLGSDEAREGSGIVGWVLRRAKRTAAEQVETYMLSGYRAEQQADGSGGGVDLRKVAARVAVELGQKLEGSVTSKLNTQLLIMLGAYAVVGIFWFPILISLASLLVRLRG